MACPIPLRIINPHYKKIASLSEEDVFNYEDRPDFYIDVGCGKCYHCLKSYKTQWNLRLQHEYKYYSISKKAKCYFITLTFSDTYLKVPHPTKKYIGNLVRRFLERVRKHYGVSVRHWFVSEYGDTTERYHLHGILFDPPFPIYQLQKYWQYGYVTYNLLTPRRITYVTTYINKQLKGLLQSPDKKQHVFASPGIGKAFVDDPLNIIFSHLDGSPVPFIRHAGREFPMPRYYRLKLFSDAERDALKEAYFFNKDEAIIPDPPYWLGSQKFDDYTLFLEACSQLRKQFNSLNYGKRKSKSDFPTARH